MTDVDPDDDAAVALERKLRKYEALFARQEKELVMVEDDLLKTEDENAALAARVKALEETVQGLEGDLAAARQYASPASAHSRRRTPRQACR